MRYTKFSNTEQDVSILGFGCAPMMGRVGKRTAQRALDIAFDHGVNYFDVARSYGYGDAEGLLGRFIQGKRDRVLVTTKFGIFPPQRSALLGAVKPVARGLISLFPAVRSRIRKGALAMTATAQYGVEDAKISLERSLRALRTDHVDSLLLHACGPDDVLKDELFDFLDTCVRAGKVRSFGVSTEKEFLGPMLEQRGDRIQILQYPHSVFDRDMELAPAMDIAHTYVSHSAFGGGVSFQRLRDMIAAGSNELQMLGTEFDIEVGNTQTLAQLVLSSAFESTAPGIVICSMYHPAHILENVRIAVQRPFGRDALNAFNNAIQRAFRESC